MRWFRSRLIRALAQGSRAVLQVRGARAAEGREVLGPTWRDPIRIQVSSQYATANTLVMNGGKPGRIDRPLDRVRDRTGALLHEITHNYAFSENRFLYEGLGVYLQDKVGEARSFPTFGRPLDAAAAEVARTVGSLEALNAVRFPRPLDR